MILVIGATGMVGSEICRLLTMKGKIVKAMVRETSDPNKVENLRDNGINIFTGDLRDPSSYSDHLEGVSTIITTISSMPFSYIPGENDIDSVDKEGMINLIDQSEKAGVNHFIYTSFSGNLDLDFPLRNAKREVEEHLKKGWMSYTILRPSCFTEVWLTAAVGFDTEHGKVQIFGEGKNPVSYISLFDVAKFAVECIDKPYAVNKTIELGGPEKISQLEAVKISEDINEEKIDVQFVPIETLSTQRKNADDPMQKSFSGLMECVAIGDPIDMNETMSEFPFQLKSVKDYAESLVHS